MSWLDSQYPGTGRRQRNITAKWSGEMKKECIFSMFGRKRVLEIKWWDPHGWGLAMTANINYRFPPIFQWQNFFVICNPFPKLLFPHRQEWAGKTLSFLWEWICKVWGWSISCYLSHSNISSSKCKPQPAFCCTCKTPGFGLAQKERNNSWNKLSGSISFWWHSILTKRRTTSPVLHKYYMYTIIFRNVAMQGTAQVANVTWHIL